MVETRRRRWHLRLTRDGILFVLGVTIILWELIIRDSVRPELIFVATALVGAVPVIRRGDKEADKHESEG
jgi:hypothetical protein